MSTTPILIAAILATATLLFPIWTWLRMLDALQHHEQTVVRQRLVEEEHRRRRYEADRAAALVQAQRRLMRTALPMKPKS